MDLSNRQGCYTISGDEHLTSPGATMYSTLPRRNPMYQPLPESTPRRESNFTGVGMQSGLPLSRTTLPFGNTPTHSKTLQSLATLANKYLSVAHKQVSNFSIQDEELAYLRAIERSDISEVKEILSVYEIHNEISSDDDTDHSSDDQLMTSPKTTKSRKSRRANGTSGRKIPALHVENELPFVMEMTPLEKRESALTKLPKKTEAKNLRDIVNKSMAGHSDKEKNAAKPHKITKKSVSEKASKTTPSSSHKKNRQVFNKNCRDQWGRTGLFIAITRRNLEMIDLLLQNKVDMGECLYHSVDFGYYDVIELLLKYDECRDHVITGEDSFYPPGLTPIQLAAHKNDFIMLKILHNHGFRIMGERDKDHQKKRVFSKKVMSDDPHSGVANYFLLERAWDQSNDRMLYYRAMSSPAYLIMMHTEGGFSDEPQDNDFLDRIFRLYGKLKKKASREPDARSMYLQLAGQVEEFSCDLLNEVRSAEDLSSLLRFDPPGHKRSIMPKNHLLPLQTASDVHMKNFVAHQHCQLTLSILRMGTLFDSDGSWKTLLIRCLLAIMFPFLSIAFIIAPNTKVGGLLRNPMVNLSCHMVSEITFLILMVARLLRMWTIECDCLGAPPDVLEYIILIWVLARAVNEVKKIREVRLVTLFSNVWKLNDFATLGLFFVVIVLRSVDYGLHSDSHDSNPGSCVERDNCDRSKWTDEESWPLIVSEGCMSFIYLLIFIRAMEMMYIDRTFGPLQLSLDKMLLDVLRFCILFFLFTFLAFACGMTQLYWAYGMPRLVRYANGSSIADALICGDEVEADTFCYPVYSNIQTTLLEQFWTIFGYGYAVEPPVAIDTPDNTRELTQMIGLVLSGLFHCWAVVVMLNMLIAMMSHSFDRVRDNAEVEWKFHRTNTWMKFIRKGVYPRPPPMNLIPSPRDVASIYHSIKNVISRCRGKRLYSSSKRRKAHRVEAPDNGIESMRYRQSINRVTNRYLRKHLLEEFQHDDDSPMLLQQQHSRNTSPRKLSASR